MSFSHAALGGMMGGECFRVGSLRGNMAPGRDSTPSISLLSGIELRIIHNRPL